MSRLLSFTALFSLLALRAAHADPAPAIPEVAPAAVAPAPSPAADDIDLSALGLDPKGGGSFDDKLNIYGFIDFEWQYEDFRTKNPYAPDTTTFFLGNFDLYLAKNLTPRWRTLAEVRFMYAPTTTANPDGTTVVDVGTDATNFDRPIAWGTISIERAYIEYDATPLLTIRAGHWLTPYGIWNTDHGSPAIIATYRPFIIGEELFPEHQTGIELYGARRLGEYKLGYHATLSNGRSQTEIIEDTNNRPAGGGRLEFEAPWGGTFKAGASGYLGRYTSAVVSTTVPTEEYDEHDLAADAQWDHGGLHVQGEVIRRHRAWTAGHRTTTLAGAPESNGADLGAYLLGGYRFDHLWSVMPFGYYEYYRPHDPGELGTVNDMNLGLNFRPTATVVLKLQGTYAFHGSGSLLQSDVLVLTTQVAWVF